MTEPAGKAKAKKAAGLYAIIIGKLLKGVVLLLVAMGFFRLSGDNLPDEFRHFVLLIHMDPEKRFFTELADRIRDVTPESLIRVAWGSGLYSLLVLTEGVGLSFRRSWAGWLSIAESAFFIPIEVRELLHHFSWTVTVILVVNVAIVWYLYVNRQRLFSQHGSKS